MAFGLNKAEVIGRLGADVTINHLAFGGRVGSVAKSGWLVTCLRDLERGVEA